ncbi:hypothetical protein QLG02_04920 [Aeromonas sp. V90_14]|uniref:hypothetical protein n=1 Tax=Aeromonas sp. V90_14 TaxID=3044241 RepID=UPI00249F872D|nr:hypothetical protein [Aeromonas sp. V90_14]MDI3429670.1 hypothetical protein [Aeromonas sp. V90_14]
MSSIQEKFGQLIIDGFGEFAKTGIPDTNKLDATWFDHVQEQTVRDALCDTLYGARWLYKIGLALQVDNKELYAHVRAQVIDYISVSETLLNEMVLHAKNKNKLTGEHWKFKDLYMNPKNKIKWTKVTNIRAAIEKQSFAWLILVAEEEKIITPPLASSLNKMRLVRNTVHITERAKNNSAYSLNSSSEAFKIMQKTINETKSWFSKNKI